MGGVPSYFCIANNFLLGAAKVTNIFYFHDNLFDQNNSYEITINGFQVRKINEKRNVIFGNISKNFGEKLTFITKIQRKSETI